MGRGSRYSVYACRALLTVIAKEADKKYLRHQLEERADNVESVVGDQASKDAGGHAEPKGFDPSKPYTIIHEDESRAHVDPGAKGVGRPAIIWSVNDASALIQKEDWQGLKNFALRWTKAEPQNSIAWNYLGRAYRANEQGTKAIEAYQQAVRINPDYAEAWHGLGSVYYFFTDQGTKAIEAYQQAVRVNPDFADAWHLLGQAYVGTNHQYAKAIEAYQQVIRIKPNDGLEWYYLGQAYVGTNQYAKAIEAYQKALRIKPDGFFIAREGLGNAYRLTGQTAKAIEEYQQAIRIRSDVAEVWYGLGSAYKISGQTGKMMEVYKRLKTLDPTKADDFFNKVVMP